MKNKKGFTILELGIVIVFMSVIAVGLTPFVKKARNFIRQKDCVTNLQKISVALRIYALENDGQVPDKLEVLKEKGYIDKDKIFDCPFSPHKGSSKEPDYIYENDFNFEQVENIPIIYDNRGNHIDNRANVLYINGEIKEEARWPSS